MTKTLKELNNLYRQTFYLEDEAVLSFLCSIVISSRMPGPPTWAYIIGPSSGGKTMLISAFSKVPFIEQISDLTPNTFLSGMSNNTQETSLLKRLGNNFIIVMKDFTTILSKSPESQEAIIAQMREIYDGHIVKYTGTGAKLEWGPNWKGTFIMASTEAIYGVQEKFSDMGTRAINYVLKDQDRIVTTKMALRKRANMEDEMGKIQDYVRDFVIEKLDQLPSHFPDLPEEFENEIIEVADFSTICRSVVKRDYRGEKNLALSPEMPMRMAKQLLGQAQTLVWLNDGVIDPWIRACVYKIAFDSIPKQRRIALEVLARYPRVTITGTATEINYNNQRSREWIEDLNMFGICTRLKSKGKEWWEMKDNYRKIMNKYLSIKTLDYNLDSEDDDGTYSTSYSGGNYGDVDTDWEAQENKRIQDENFEKLNFDTTQTNKPTQSPGTALPSATSEPTGTSPLPTHQ